MSADALLLDAVASDVEFVASPVDLAVCNEAIEVVRDASSDALCEDSSERAVDTLLSRSERSVLLAVSNESDASSVRDIAVDLATTCVESAELREVFAASLAASSTPILVDKLVSPELLFDVADASSLSREVSAESTADESAVSLVSSEPSAESSTDSSAARSVSSDVSAVALADSAEATEDVTVES